MPNSEPLEDLAAVPLSHAIWHPLFSEALRAVVIAMSKNPGTLAIEEIFAPLGMDPQIAAESFVAAAEAAEYARVLAVEAMGVKAVH